VPAGLPNIQATPAAISFSPDSGGAPVTQPLTVLGSLTGLDFTVGVQTAAGGSWLSVDTGPGVTPRILNVTAESGGTAPRTYQAGVTITPAAATPSSLRIPVTFTVGQAQPAHLSVDTGNLTFTFPAGAAAERSQVRVANGGGGLLIFNASVTTAAGGPWLSVSTTSGSVTPGNPFSLRVQAASGAVEPSARWSSAKARSTTRTGCTLLLNSSSSDLRSLPETDMRMVRRDIPTE
jgi:hypothetical protein